MDYSDVGSIIDPSVIVQPEPRQRHALLGIGLTIASGLTMSMLSLAVKMLDTLPTFYVSAYRLFVLALSSSVSLYWRRINPLEPLRRCGWWLIWRGILGAGGTVLRFYALQNMPIGDANALQFSNPVIVAVLSWALLGEPIGLLGVLGTALMLGGALFVARPEVLFGASELATATTTLATLSAIGGAFLGACIYTLVRHLRDEPQEVVIFYHSTVGTLVLVLGALIDGSSALPHGVDYVYLAMLGAFGYLGAWLMTTALKVESANVVALGRTADVLWGYALQVVWFGQTPDWISIFGAALIVVSIVVVSLERIRTARQRAATGISRAISFDDEEAKMALVGGSTPNKYG